MKSGQCPKCGSTDIRKKQRGLDPKGGMFFSTNGVTYTYVKLDTYACVRCGYVESYLTDPAQVAQIAQGWEKVEKKP